MLVCNFFVSVLPLFDLNTILILQNIIQYVIFKRIFIEALRSWVFLWQASFIIKFLIKFPYFQYIQNVFFFMLQVFRFYVSSHLSIFSGSHNFWYIVGGKKNRILYMSSRSLWCNIIITVKNITFSILIW